MKRLSTLIACMLICSIAFASCTLKEGPNCHKRVTVINNTHDRIYAYYGWSFPDTGEAAVNISSNPEEYRVEAGGSNNTAIVTSHYMCLEMLQGEKEYGTSNEGRLIIYIYEGSVIDDILANGGSWLNRSIEKFYFTFKELQEMDFTLHYYGPSDPDGNE